MGKLLNYLGESKILKRIADVLNVTDVKVNGASVVDSAGIANIDLSLYAKFEVVQTLPASGESGIIYLVPKTTAQSDNVYDEYIWTNNDWELIGSTEIDLSNYYTKTETDTLLDDKVDWESNGLIGAKNLNGYPYYEATHTDAGVDFTDNGDGTVSASGKSTSSTRSGFVCHSRSVDSLNELILPNGTYKLSGCPSGGTDNSYYIEVGRTSSGGLVRYGRDYGSGLTFTINGDDNFNDKARIQLVCYCVKDYQIPSGSPLLFKPMIRIASDTDATWQEYAMTNLDLTKNAIVNQVYTESEPSTVPSYIHYFLASHSNTTSNESKSVKKIAHGYINGNNGNVVFCRKHSNTSVQNHIFAIGNETADGYAGATDGIMRLFGKGAFYAQIYDQYNYLTANRNYYFNDQTGILAVKSDITDFAVMSRLKTIDDNLLYPYYYHANGANGGINYSTNFKTGEYSVKGSHTSNVALNLKRYTQGFYLSAGKYKISGCPSGGSSSKYSIRVYKSTEQGQTTGIGSDYGSGLEFTLTERTLMQIVFYINANQNVDFTFRPKLEKLSDWVDLGVQTIGSTITLTEQYSELMVEVNYGDVFYQNIHILRTQLTSIPKYYYATISEDYDFYASVYLDGTDIKLKGNTQVSGTDYNLYAKY